MSHGAADTLIDPRGVYEYADALEAAGVSVRRRIAPGAGHGFGLDCGWADEFLEWIKSI